MDGEGVFTVVVFLAGGIAGLALGLNAGVSMERIEKARTVCTAMGSELAWIEPWSEFACANGLVVKEELP